MNYYKLCSKIFLGVLIAFTVCANDINIIELLTSKCHDCGIGAFGNIRVRVCSSLTICCDTGHLDHLLKNDFQEGKISVFTETQIGQCSHFDLGDDTNGDNIKMVLEHSGTDGGQFDWVKVYTPEGVYTCHFGDFIDNGQHQLGHDCNFFRTD